MPDANLYARFAALDAANTAPFIEPDGGAPISYADAHAASGRYANALKALGVGRGGAS